MGIDIDVDTFKWVVGEVAQLKKRVEELESGKPRTVLECMQMDSERFEAMVEHGDRLTLKPTELRAIRIYQHRYECISTIIMTKQQGGEEIQLLRTRDSKIKSMLARYEKGMAPRPKAIVRAMKAVVINQVGYEAVHERSPIVNGVQELRTRDNEVVYRQNRQLIPSQTDPKRVRVKGGGKKRSWFVGKPDRSESLLIFKEHNGWEDLEKNYPHIFEFPLPRSESRKKG